MTTTTQRKFLSLYKGGHCFVFYYDDSTHLELATAIVEMVMDPNNNLDYTDFEALRIRFEWQKQNG